MRLLKFSLQYFAMVFGAGFVLGVLRVSFLVPRLGERWSELIEMPLMLGVTVFAAIMLFQKRLADFSAAELLTIGVLALSVLVFFEIGLVIGLRGISIPEYVAEKDPVSGVVYLVMLLIFALMPWFVCRMSYRRNRDSA